MVRLLERASFRRNDPDLFAGLVQACRYCDELGASMAAHERGCHLDPNLVTSAAHTYFLLGDYAKSLDCYGNKVGYYLDCAALAALGDDKAALAKLREREHRGGATGAVQAIMRSLRAYLEGDFAECVQAIELGEPLTRRDPETLYYMARHLARVNEPERAITMLTRALEGGFFMQRLSCEIHGSYCCAPRFIMLNSCVRPSENVTNCMPRFWRRVARNC
jgi:tetratricopeptide (TPR) repeat protein